jgi:hypothetical protein
MGKSLGLFSTNFHHRFFFVFLFNSRSFGLFAAQRLLICVHLAEICGKFWLWLRYAASFVVLIFSFFVVHANFLRPVFSVLSGFSQCFGFDFGFAFLIRAFLRSTNL